MGWPFKDDIEIQVEQMKVVLKPVMGNVLRDKEAESMRVVPNNGVRSCCIMRGNLMSNEKRPVV